MMIINFTPSQVSIDFFLLSQKFKLLTIPNVLALGKLYEHSFMKKCNSHNLCTKSSFDWFFVHHFGNSKYWLFQTY
ncbi:hypothetical protein B296_00026891 [Ensete ventricosum]|uniref:Uncharacterized protein n=1 Tax=Ensete ventricosum TaxID=4639 RepID=A0A426X647_ENSVE|nr:hypothetical protein B296_00026891 [Ensete ventricosum]